MDENILNSFDYWIFDLDDTLYPETKYLNNAYEIISEYIGKKYNQNPAECLEFLISDFRENGRSYLFDRFIDKYSLEKEELSFFMNVLRSQTLIKKISLFPKTKNLLDKLINCQKKLFLVTNGNPIQQRNKLENITFSKYLNYFTIIFANEIEPKPSPIAFLKLKENCSLSDERTIMIGDSDVDKEFAFNSGISFLNIKKINYVWNIRNNIIKR